MTNLNAAPAEQREALPRMEYIRDALVDTTYAPGRALDPSVTALNLVHPEVDLLQRVNYIRAAMLQDPRHRERGVSFWVASHKLIIPRDPNDMTIGDDHSVWAKSPEVQEFFGDLRGEPIFLQDKLFAVSPHGHKIHQAFSPADLRPLFYNEDCMNMATAAWVVTPEGTGVVFRGPGTPELEFAECAQLEQDWTDQIYRDVATRVRPGLTDEERTRATCDANAAWFNGLLAQPDLHLQFFAGGVGDSVLLKHPVWR